MEKRAGAGKIKNKEVETSAKDEGCCRYMCIFVVGWWR